MNPTTLDLDKPRELRFRFPDELKLARRCGGKGTTEILERLGVGDPEVLVHTLSIGLAHAERDLESNLDRVAELIDAGLRKGTSKALMNSAIIAALKAAGILPKDKEGAADTSTP